MTREEIRAVILAAGRGERLRPLTRSTPKQLIPVGGKPILEHTLGVLEQAGVSSIIFVTGYRERRIQQYVARQFAHLKTRFIRNPIYARTNTLYSLWLARSAVNGRPLLLIDGDLVFEPVVLRSVLCSRGECLLACDSSAAPDDEGVRVSGEPRGRIVRIGKNAATSWTALGESIGLARISSQASRWLFRTCGAILRSGGQKQYYEAAFQRMIEQGLAFSAVDIRGAKWVEIDTKADLRRARVLFSGCARPAV